MTISKEKNDSALTFHLGGRLDTTTAPAFEAELRSSLDGIADLTIDLKELEYISSAGLRVLLSAQKVMNSQGSMRVTNVCEAVNEVFDVTGFVDILTIE